MRPTKVTSPVAPFRYRPVLHTVRRVKNEDFKRGYRIAVGQFVACDGAWDRKGIIERVHLPESDEYGTSITVDVVFAGHYFAKPSQRILNDVVYRYNPVTRETIKRNRRPETTMRFYKKTYVAPAKISRSKVAIHFRPDGSIRLHRSGWVPVLPR